ncbi:MAG: aldo/keto reductase [Verrucomicrobiota bacterium]
MKLTPLPRTDLAVSPLCLGCWGIVSDFHWGERDKENSIRTILAAVDAGINFFDTAPLYGNGASETLLGEIFADNHLRDQVVIASKIPPDRMGPEAIQAECEDSLKRLRTDVIDLYQTHWTSREVPLADSWGAMLDLKQQGKVRHIGVCNMGLGDLGEISLPVTNQLPYGLLWRAIETGILPHSQEKDIGVLAYSPLMHGILSDKYARPADVPDGRARTRHFSPDRAHTRHDETGCETETFAALDRVRAIAHDLGRSTTDVALAWAIQQPGVAGVIAGAGHPDQLKANTAAIDHPLSDNTLQQLTEATDPLKTALGPNPDMWDSGKQARFR